MTSAAALEVLGPGYKFHTVAAYSGTRSGKTVSGNRYLRGQGDPAELLTKAMGRAKSPGARAVGRQAWPGRAPRWRASAWIPACSRWATVPA
jgi:D-alanyl-D-alanine carboxypeptidase